MRLSSEALCGDYVADFRSATVWTSKAEWVRERCRKNSKAMRERWRKDGKCVRCGDPLVEGSTHFCKFQLVEHRKRVRAANGHNEWRPGGQGRPPLIPDSDGVRDD